MSYLDDYNALWNELRSPALWHELDRPHTSGNVQLRANYVRPRSLNTEFRFNGLTEKGFKQTIEHPDLTTILEQNGFMPRTPKLDYSQFRKAMNKVLTKTGLGYPLGIQDVYNYAARHKDTQRISDSNFEQTLGHSKRWLIVPSLEPPWFISSWDTSLLTGRPYAQLSVLGLPKEIADDIYRGIIRIMDEQ